MVIGLALALAGAAVGTAAGVDTPFQKVIVVNPIASPVPVVQQGPVSISNLPTNQTVTVSNFPATQAVTVSNLPAIQDIDGEVRIKDVRVFNEFAVWPNGARHTFTFNGTMHVTGVTLSDSIGTDTMSVYFITNTAAGEVDIRDHSDGGFSRDFTAPFPARSVQIQCENLVLDCDAELTVFGY
jgi:hypothetical protein